MIEADDHAPTVISGVDPIVAAPAQTKIGLEVTVKAVSNANTDTVFMTYLGY